MRHLLFGLLLCTACDRPPSPPPDVVVKVPAEPIPEPEVLPPEDAGPPAKIIGSFHGVPIQEQGPWTRTLPPPEGSFTASALPTAPARGTIHYESGPGILTGACVLKVGDKPAGSPRVRVELQVKSGRVRVFLKYLGDIYLTLDAGPGEVAALEGAGLPGHGASINVMLEALDGPAHLQSVKVTSVSEAVTPGVPPSVSRRELQMP